MRSRRIPRTLPLRPSVALKPPPSSASVPSSPRPTSPSLSVPASASSPGQDGPAGMQSGLTRLLARALGAPRIHREARIRRRTATRKPLRRLSPPTRTPARGDTRPRPILRRSTLRSRPAPPNAMPSAAWPPALSNSRSTIGPPRALQVTRGRGRAPRSFAFPARWAVCCSSTQ